MPKIHTNCTISLSFYYSWTLFNDIAIKNIDKSAFYDKNTGVPIEVLPFFNCSNLNNREKFNFKLLYNDYLFDAYIKKDINGKGKLIWYKDFSEVIQNTSLFDPDINIYKNGKMIFKKLDNFTYIIELTDNTLEEILRNSCIE